VNDNILRTRARIVINDIISSFVILGIDLGIKSLEQIQRQRAIESMKRYAEKRGINIYISYILMKRYALNLVLPLILILNK